MKASNKPLKEVSAKLDAARQTFGKTESSWNDWFTQERNVKQAWMEKGDKARADDIQKGIDAKEEGYRRFKTESVEAKAVASAEEELALLKEQSTKPIGMAERDAILQKLAENNPFIGLMYMMFLLIEAMAFLVKMIKGPDEYDYIVQKLDERAHEAEMLEEKRG